MLASIVSAKRLDEKLPTIYILNKAKEALAHLQDKSSKNYASAKLQEEAGRAIVFDQGQWKYFLLMPEKKEKSTRYEALRKAGSSISTWANDEKLESLQCMSQTQDLGQDLLCLAEGAQLAGYQFLKYKTKKKENTLKKMYIVHEAIGKKECTELNTLTDSVAIARTLVNEPLIHLTAEQLSKEIDALAKRFGFKLEVLNRSKIKSLKMGGLLAVNAGSPNPPTFNILEYKPTKPQNSQPFVLVGKGVVYDTGGLSLKPTGGSMDYMKSDMAGAAAVIGAFCAIAGNKLPIHVIGLIPATENRPDGNAITPGDVISMFDGQTVEILNTDAEGRLILGDALAYAKKLKPALAIDLATLTGAALRAIGHEGAVMMGTASLKEKAALSQAGEESYERMVEFPMWEEYEAQLKSDIADFSNLGGANAGATTAGLFLKKFVDFPWIHLDIAGPSYLHAADSYRGKNGTGYGVRLLYHFFKKMAK